jgi:hypothetical protein
MAGQKFTVVSEELTASIFEGFKPEHSPETSVNFFRSDRCPIQMTVQLRVGIIGVPSEMRNRHLKQRENKQTRKEGMTK